MGLVLVACEESQEVCKAFRALGHEAYSCDILEQSGGRPEWHIQGDALEALKSRVWDLVIAHPPCTYLSNAGAPWLFRGGALNKERYGKGLEAKDFFLTFLNADCPRVCVENPTPSKVYGLPAHQQVIHPWQFGHPLKKRTQLWLRGLPELQPTEIVQPTHCLVSSGGNKLPSMGRQSARERSKTFSGVAQAMARQWGALLGV